MLKSKLLLISILYVFTLGFVSVVKADCLGCAVPKYSGCGVASQKGCDFVGGCCPGFVNSGPSCPLPGESDKYCVFPEPPACSGETAPTAPTANATLPSGNITPGGVATLTWSAPSSWGKKCPSNNNQYYVYVNTTGVAPTSGSTTPPSGNYGPVLASSSLSTTYSTANTSGVTYYWWVASYNGFNWALSNRGTFSTTVTIRGRVAEVASASSCGTLTNFTNGYIESTLAQVRVRTPSNTVITTVPVNYTGDGSYTASGIPKGTTIGSVCFLGTVHSNISDATYKSVCPAADKCQSFGVSGLVLNADRTVNLGFAISSDLIGWYTSLSGDIFSGGNISKTMPTSPAGGFSNYLSQINSGGSAAGSVFASSTISITGNRVAQSTAPYVSNLGSTNPLLAVSGFVAPPASGSTSFTLGSTLNPNTIYYYPPDDPALVIPEGTNYQISGNGVAVVYVDNDLTFQGDYRVSGVGAQTKRVMFIVRGNVTIAPTVGYALSTEPLLSSRPNIEASLISYGNVTFSAGSTAPVVEGPLVANNIIFGRDRGLANSYPSEVIVYNPIYLIELSSKLKAGTLSYPGITMINTLW